MARFARPRTLDEALGLLAGGGWRILAGGTDFYPAQGARPLVDDVLDVTDIAEIRGIRRVDGQVRIGAGTTWSAIAAADLPPSFDALRAAAREVGSVQIQNRATIAGNLCNASPAADGVPPLLVFDAEVELRSAGGVRTMPLAGFICGSRRTARRDDELVSAVLIPERACAGRSAFVKLGARRYLVISIAMVATRLALDENGAIAAAAVAVGACSPVAIRLPALETALVGQPLGDAAAIAEASHLSELSPLDDVRATAAYRREAALELVRRALSACAGQSVAAAA